MKFSPQILFLILFCNHASSDFFSGIVNFVSDIALPPCTETTEDTRSKISFYLSTPNNKANPILLNSTNLNLIDPKVCMVILVNGWLVSYTMRGFQDLKNQYLSCKSCQIIEVDWDYYSHRLYGDAACYTRTVGKSIGKFLNASKMPVELVHCVGFSLGSHVCGFAGKEVQALSNGKKLKRVTGLDPAGFGATNAPEKKKLNKNDATIVDLVHTSSLPMGYPFSLGSVDVWVNGGKNQPCCPFCAKDLVKPENLVGGLVMIVACDHMVAVKYMIQSVCTKKYKAIYCNDIENGPENCNSSIQATFGENLEENVFPGNYTIRL